MLIKYIDKIVIQIIHHNKDKVTQIRQAALGICMCFSIEKTEQYASMNE